MFRVRGEREGDLRHGRSRSYEVLREDEPRIGRSPERVYLVDGKVRDLLEWRDRPYRKALVSQVVVGAAVLDKRGLKLDDEPEVVFVVSVARGMNLGEIRRSLELEEMEKLGEVVFVEGEGNLSEEARIVMTEREMNLAMRLAERGDGLVLKDGSLKPIFSLRLEPSFIPGSGPVGLVKNVEETLSPEDEDELLALVGVGERSKAFRVIYSKEDGEIRLLSSYLRVGERTFLRIDAVEKRGMTFEVLELFDDLVSWMRGVSVDVEYGRYPSDVAPMQGLEQLLSAYMIDPSLARYAFSGV